MSTVKQPKFYHGTANTVTKEMTVDLNRKEVKSYKITCISSSGAMDIISLLVVYDIKVEPVKKVELVKKTEPKTPAATVTGDSSGIEELMNSDNGDSNEDE